MAPTRNREAGRLIFEGIAAKAVAGLTRNLAECRWNDTFGALFYPEVARHVAYVTCLNPCIASVTVLPERKGWVYLPIRAKIRWLWFVARLVHPCRQTSSICHTRE